MEFMLFVIVSQWVLGGLMCCVLAAVQTNIEGGYPITAYVICFLFWPIITVIALIYYIYLKFKVELNETKVSK